MISRDSPACRAKWAAERVSLGKQAPPKPGPAWRNFGPIRPSSPMPRARSCTSAPMLSHRLAISLMKEIFVARNELAAYLVSSEVAMLVITKGVSFRKSGR